METRIQPGAMAGFGCLIQVKMTRPAGDPPGSVHITVQIFVFRDNPLKYTDPDGNEIFLPLLILAGATALLITSDVQKPMPKPNPVPLDSSGTRFSNSSGFANIYPLGSNPIEIGGAGTNLRAVAEIDTNSNTVKVDLTADVGRSFSSDISIETTASVISNGNIHDSGRLSPDSMEQKLLPHDALDLGSTTLRLPFGADKMDVSVETKSTFMSKTSTGTSIIGTKTIEIPIYKGNGNE
jgi:hypothetical protein